MAVSIIPTCNSTPIQEQCSPVYTLLWRRGQLLVLPATNQQKNPYLLSVEREQFLAECLKHSPVRLVCIDPSLGETKLKYWADNCLIASKPLFLRIPSPKKPRKQNCRFLGLCWSAIAWFAALVLLMIFTPVMVVWCLPIQMSSPGPFFVREWRVGKRGKLFRVFKLRIEEDKHTPLTLWIRKYGLDRLPQLFNVLRFEMCLVGPHCWTLKEATELSPSARQGLNYLPGFIKWH